MSAADRATSIAVSSIDATIEQACRAIAPSWPLDRQIAVNPYWGFIDQPFRQVAVQLHKLIGGHFGLPLQSYREAWRRGEITASALARALDEPGMPAATVAELLADSGEPLPGKGLPLLSDTLDRLAQQRSGPLWSDTITQQISQFCASYFDEQQADWHRGRASGLYAQWRASLLVDHALEPLMHAPQIRARAGYLPERADAAIAWACDSLGIPSAESLELLQLCLLRINGWASWCAYLRWEATLAGASDPHLRELLAIRISWETLLHDGRRDPGSAWQTWREQCRVQRHAPLTPLDEHLLIWQRAHEISYQDRLVGLLVSQRPSPTTAQPELRPAAQLVFCIDVRSERLRRALEQLDSGFETRGFAGFFGLPLRYRPIGSSFSRPQLPGLLPPALEATDSTGNAEEDAAIATRRARRLNRLQGREPFQRAPTGAFSLVETLGIGFAGALLRRHFGAESASIDSFGLAQQEARGMRPHLAPENSLSKAGRADLLASILRAIGLTGNFARVIVLVGHGSQSANNPQAAALDCGACGGQTGEVNARVLAGLLNDPEIRSALNERGIAIPGDTVAIPALHNTTTDEVTLFDLDRVPASHAGDLERLQRNLLLAASHTRAERAPDLGLHRLIEAPERLLKSLQRRATDWAETRPEWGLANNAALIVAPRARTRGLDLAGRCFLHEYAPAADADGALLEQIMTAPMIVAHWINLQYYASTVDPERFGSGNKVLHNVACGRIGVFEGNTGDLRVGLSRQSVHDGQRWMHAPLRLSVLIDAPRARIDAVLARHARVQQLVANQWLYLFRFADDDDCIEHHRNGQWQSWAAGHTA